MDSGTILKVELFVIIVNSWKLLAIFLKGSILRNQPLKGGLGKIAVNAKMLNTQSTARDC